MSLQRCNSSPDFVVARSVPGMQSRSFGNNGRRYRYAARHMAGGIPPPSGSLAHEIVDCAFRSVKPQFISEDVRDIPIRQPALAQLVYQFAVRFQAGPPGFLGHLAQNVLELVFHIPPKLRQHTPDRGRTSSGQKPDNDRTASLLCRPPKPKPPGLGMVSSLCSSSRGLSGPHAVLDRSSGMTLNRKQRRAGVLIIPHGALRS